MSAFLQWIGDVHTAIAQACYLAADYLDSNDDDWNLLGVHDNEPLLEPKL